MYNAQPLIVYTQYSMLLIVRGIIRGMRLRTMLTYMRGYYTLMDTIFAYPQYIRGHYTLIYSHIYNICVRVQCKYCAGVLCCNVLYTVQSTLNSLYICSLYSLYYSK